MAAPKNRGDVSKEKDPKRVAIGKKGGRPSSFTPEIAQRICDELVEGKSLIQICEAADMPHRLTVMRWLDDPAKESFATDYARARVSQADFMDDRILQVADASTVKTALADRVKIGAYQWRAERLMPKRYGVKVHKEVTGADGGPVKVNLSGLSDDELEVLERAFTRTAGSTSEDDTGGEK